jgi:hypothetical protein
VPLESPTVMNDTCNSVSGKLIYDNYIMVSRSAVFETQTKHSIMKHISATESSTKQKLIAYTLKILFDFNY